MDFGVTGKLWEYGINSRTGAIAEKNVDGSFAEIAAAKVAEKEASLRSVNEMRTTGANHYMGESYEERISKITDKTAASAFQTAYAKKMAGATDGISAISRAYSTGKAGATNFEDAFPQYDVITHVGNANISSGNWQRNDFPFWKYFDRNTSADALNDWKPKGANPSQMRSDLQRNYNSVGSGRIAILVPESLQQKMDADPEYARQIIAKLQTWKEDYDRWDNTVAASYGYNVAEYQAGKSYVFDLDENGDVRNCTVTGPGRITISSSEFVEARKAREAKHAEYEKLAEESALKQRVDITGTSFINQLKKKGETEGTSRVDAYTEYLRSKYGNVRIQNVGKDQQSLDRIEKSMNGSDVVIAPNILEQMAKDKEKAAYYEGKIDDFFHATPMLQASFAAQGLDYQPCGVVIHEDGSVTYIGGCADSPERVAEVNTINKAKREKEAAQRKANMERSREAAGEQKRQMDLSI